MIQLNFYMTEGKLYKQLLILVLCLNVAFSQTATCPSSSYSTLLQDRFTISSMGNVNLQTNVDAICYSYTLPLPFQNTPGVAVAVQHMEAVSSMDLFFSVRSTKTSQVTVLSFLIRTQWKYTQWIKISISFIAEDQANIEANSFNIDTSSLAGCSNTKQVSVMLPYKTQGFSPIKALTFINGFEISSQAGSTNSPFEIQIINIAIGAAGVSLSATITSSTRVFNVFVSLVAYDSTLAFAYSDNYLYNTYYPTGSLSATPTFTIANPTLSFYGITGFIISNTNTNFVFDATFSTTFTLTTSTSFQYLSFNYFFMNTPLCSNCNGYPIYYNGVCYNTCPANTYLSGNTCIACPLGQTWNGVSCVGVCTGGQVWNTQSNSCQCPSNLYWSGSACISCSGGQIWNSQTNSCVCSFGLQWNGSSCVQCSGGQIWNSQTNSCACPNGMQWNGVSCINAPICSGGQVYNPSTLSCQCPAGQYWTGSACMSCSNGQSWNPQTNSCQCPVGQYWTGSYCQACNSQTPSNLCQCPTGQYWTGSSCQICSNGQFWNPQTNSCQCPSGQSWTGSICAACANGQIWNPATNSCGCPQGQYWTGSYCSNCLNGQIWNSQTNSCSCPSGLYWNGYSCITCPSGQSWNSQLNQCSCPSGQNWNGFSCISCSGGQIWNSSINACGCLNGLNWNGSQCVSCAYGQYWNGYSCISCTGGQVWSASTMNCQCQAGYQWNGTQCIIPCPAGQISVNGICQCPYGTYLVNGICQNQPSCPSGQVWNGTACSPISCSPGTYWNGTICVTPNVPCPAGTYYNGYTCVAITNQCPSGTYWNGNICVTNTTTQCPTGTYWNGVSCQSLSCQCPAGMNWVNGQCVANSNNCPSGTYFNGQTCQPYNPCTGGRIWNAQMVQCTCPSNSFWNGMTCISCGSGQVYSGYAGCSCPVGTFLNGSICSPVPQSQCTSIPNSQWNGNQCVCLTGYTQQGTNCICNGLVVNGVCNPCYLMPNSQLLYGVCQCLSGYYPVNGQCQQITPNPPSPTTPTCSVASYFDNQQNRCLPCSDGCLSCSSCYQCTQCRPQYNYNPSSQLCVQICGDGKRFSLQCDDGNNNNGDGCSMDCHIQVGYSCTGGSPNSKDTCTSTLPSTLVITQSGQSHLKNQIVLNIRLNYMPQSLIKSATDCKNGCDSVLNVTIISGFSSVVSIKSTYIPTTSFSFSVVMDFGREPIGLFTAQVGIQSGIALKYYSGIDTSQALTVNVNPAFLSTNLMGSKKTDCLK